MLSLKIAQKNIIKSKKIFFLRKINKIIELNQDEIVVAIGIIIKPTVLKYNTLIIIFKNTEITDI